MVKHKVKHAISGQQPLANLVLQCSKSSITSFVTNLFFNQKLHVFVWKGYFTKLLSSSEKGLTFIAEKQSVRLFFSDLRTFFNYRFTVINEFFVLKSIVAIASYCCKPGIILFAFQVRRTNTFSFYYANWTCNSFFSKKQLSEVNKSRFI